ncbi:MAG TPA: hypothetical protein VLM85_25530 [Polyangiaceae bacterium]|nr:hypothetical protein [Polyangiaceae bacterium]
MLASAAKLRPKIIPRPAGKAAAPSDEPPKKGCRYWPWAEVTVRF